MNLVVWLFVCVHCITHSPVSFNKSGDSTKVEFVIIIKIIWIFDEAEVLDGATKTSQDELFLVFSLIKQTRRYIVPHHWIQLMRIIPHNCIIRVNCGSSCFLRIGTCKSERLQESELLLIYMKTAKIKLVKTKHLYIFWRN